MNIPDRWQLLKIKYKDEPIIYKVIGAWTRNDAWKLNSGIDRTEETDEYYDFHGYSGSIYRCYKDREGPLRGYAQEILDNLMAVVKKEPGACIKVIELRRKELL